MIREKRFAIENQHLNWGISLLNQINAISFRSLMNERTVLSGDLLNSLILVFLSHFSNRILYVSFFPIFCFKSMCAQYNQNAEQIQLV